MEERTIPSDAPSEYMRGYSDGVEWARQQEREECAKVCDETSSQAELVVEMYMAQECAAAIRARQNT